MIKEAEAKSFGETLRQQTSCPLVRQDDSQSTVKAYFPMTRATVNVHLPKFENQPEIVI